MITELSQWLLPFQGYSYYIVFGILMVCGLGVPVPEDLTIVVAGVLVSYEVTDFWKTFAVCMAGVLTGDTFIFAMGRFLGDKLVKSNFFSSMIKARYIAMVKLASRKYGNYLIFLARFLPGARTAVFFSIGAFRKPFSLFFFIDAAAALISVPLWIYVGVIFGQNIPALERHIKQMKLGMYIFLAAAIILVVLFHFLNKKILALFFKKAG